MGYESPSYQDLQHKTKRLETSFNQLSNRYIPPRYADLYARVQNLETEYLDTVKEKPTLPHKISIWAPFGIGGAKVSKRTAQIRCITQLTQKRLEDPKSKNEENKQRSHLILLGALIYRLKRLEEQEIPLTKYAVMKAYCGEGILKELLEHTLNISNENKLDDQSLSNCCEAYADYLDQTDVKEQFSYIKSNPQFMRDLHSLVQTSRVNSEQVHSQLQLITFVDSVRKNIETTDNLVKESISSLVKLVNKKLAKTKNEGLSFNDLIDLLNNLSPSPLVEEMMLELLPPFPAKVTIQGIDFAPEGNGMTFEGYMHEKLKTKSHYALLGAYLLALDKCNTSTPYLLRALNLALGITSRNWMDEETQELSLIALKNYLTLPIPNYPPLFCLPWGKNNGREYMEKTLEIMLSKLTQEAENTSWTSCVSN